MRVIAKKILRQFWEMHADSEEQFKTWYKKYQKLPGELQQKLSQNFRRQVF